MRGFEYILAIIFALASVSSSHKRVVCYYGSWATYRPGAGKFDVNDIDPTLCTHLIYTFVGLEGNNIRLLDAWQDLPDGGGKDGFNKFNALRKKSPNTKTLIAIGGWNEGSAKYSQMASTAESREAFASNALAFVEKYNFDGFDVDWEYPAQRGGSPNDYKNYVELLKELKNKFQPKGLILSAAVSAAESSAGLSFDIPQISKYLDFINIMAYDLKGAWEPTIGMNAALKPAASDSGNDLQLNVVACVNFWLKSGAPKEKLNLGVPFYGRAFTLANPANNKVGSASTGPGAAGPYTREAGMLGYNEICEMHLKEKWDVHYDEERHVPYAQKGNQWVSFDNIDSMIEKAKLINEMDLGGVMIWSLETDDFRGNCGDKYPLLTALNEALNGPVTEKPGSTASTTKKPASEKPEPTSERPVKSTTHKAETTTPDDSDWSFVCPGVGYYPDPKSCDFYQCYKDEKGGYKATKLSCPPELCFNPVLDVCDWP